MVVEGRPNEGDLIYFPLAKKIFEIKFVEHEAPFYQLNNLYVWELRCELFEYSDENFETGDTTIDAIETTFANSIALTLQSGGSGDFSVGESVFTRLYYPTAGSTISGGAVSAVTVTDGGSGYTSAPTVTFSAPTTGTTATGTTTISNSGIVTGVTITNPGSGYTVAPTVTFGRSPAEKTGEVKAWDSANRKLTIINRSGDLTGTLDGGTSNAQWSVETYSTIDNTNSDFDQNKYIETTADGFLDFTEGNPFGEFGNQGLVCNVRHIFIPRNFKKDCCWIWNFIQQHRDPSYFWFTNRSYEGASGIRSSAKFLKCLDQVGDLESDNATQITPPRMSFEINGITYDAQRKVAPTQAIRVAGSSRGSVKKVSCPCHIMSGLN